jgi:alginate O-acetyltransferase complex protein AlgI
MLFNSYSFIFLFLPAVLLGYFALGRRSNLAPAVWLALASLVLPSAAGSSSRCCCFRSPSIMASAIS